MTSEFLNNLSRNKKFRGIRTYYFIPITLIQFIEFFLIIYKISPYIVNAVRKLNISMFEKIFYANYNFLNIFVSFLDASK